MHKIKTKPLSVNEAYRGRRFATDSLTTYKNALTLALPKINVPDAFLKVFYRFGVSSRASDGDNLIKAFQDCLSEQYGFNDNKIYHWTIEKVIVPRGKEYIEFSIEELK